MVSFSIHDDLKRSVVKLLLQYDDADNNAATEQADVDIQNLPKPNWYVFFIICHPNTKNA